MYIIIPMAGESSRFFNAGYTVPKYMLPLGSETVFDKAIKSFKDYFNNAVFVFVVRNDKYDSFEFVDDHVKMLGIKWYYVHILKEPTKGQAETVYKFLAERGLEDSMDELVIFNIDTIRHNLKIPVGNFTSYFDAFYDDFPDPKFSFCETSKEFPDSIIRTAEKKVISNWCSTGLYIFSSVRIYANAYKAALDDELLNGNTYNYYIAPLYNYIIPKTNGVPTEKSSNYLLKCPLLDVEFCGVPDEYEALKIKYKTEQRD